MSSILSPVILRLLTYVLSSLVLMIPASYAGIITFDQATDALSMSLPTLAGIVAGAIVVSGGILAKWGIPVEPEAVKAVVLRVMVYATSPALAMVPASWAGIVAFDPATQLVTLGLPALVKVAGAALITSSAIFAKWGVKSAVVAP